ncbi:MAG: efflux RND transporter periplasmic adaptor subunit [Sulfurovum sp.]
MKKLLLLLIPFTLTAQNITLSPQQEQNWQIESLTPSPASKIPLGEFVTRVVTPPSLLYTISLPFEANVKKLNIAKYQEVKKNQILTTLTSAKWVSTQQEAIANAIELRHQKDITKRKNLLCKEEIIPQKECITSKAKLEMAKIKVSTSKALLQSYGADNYMIIELFEHLRLYPIIELKSSVDGRVVSIQAATGKSTTPSEALFVIQQKGALWLESAIEAKRTIGLYEGQKVSITLDSASFDTTIIQLSPIINPQNQTRDVRFAIPLEVEIFSGLRTNAIIHIAKDTVKIEKKAVIKYNDKQIVFIKTPTGYNSVEIEILSENDNSYFVKPSKALTNKIATSSLAILKNMLGEDDE